MKLSSAYRIESKKRQALPGFTLIELLVVIATITILTSLLCPALARAKDKGRTAKCGTNERQMIMAAIMFEQDNNVYPAAWPPPLWYTQLQPYVGRKESVAGKGVFVCPSSFQKAQPNEGSSGIRDGGFWGFLAYSQNFYINTRVTNVSSVDICDPDETIFYGDSDGWDAVLYSDGVSGNVCYRHSGGNERSAQWEHGVGGPKGAIRRANAVFVAGHVQLIKAAPARLFTLARD